MKRQKKNKQNLHNIECTNRRPKRKINIGMNIKNKGQKSSMLSLMIITRIKKMNNPKREGKI